MLSVGCCASAPPIFSHEYCGTCSEFFETFFQQLDHVGKSIPSLHTYSMYQTFDGDYKAGFTICYLLPYQQPLSTGESTAILLADQSRCISSWCERHKFSFSHDWKRLSFLEQPSPWPSRICSHPSPCKWSRSWATLCVWYDTHMKRKGRNSLEC